MRGEDGAVDRLRLLRGPLTLSSFLLFYYNLDATIRTIMEWLLCNVMQLEEFLHNLAPLQ